MQSIEECFVVISKPRCIYDHPLAEVDLWHLVATGLWLFSMKGFCVTASISLNGRREEREILLVVVQS